MEIKMQYFLLVSVTTFGKERVGDFLPSWINLKDFKKSAVEKESDGERRYYEHKYCSRPMSQEQIIPIMEDSFSSTCKTMGSLTLEYGWQDAISFTSDDGRVNAYVSPIAKIPAAIIEIAEKEPFTYDKIQAVFRRHLDWLYDFFKTDERPEPVQYIDVETIPLFQ